MNQDSNLSVSEEVYEQAQQEGAGYLRVLAVVMDEIRCIHENSELLPYFKRFYRAYRGLYPHAMIILRGLTPTEDPAKIESLQQYNQDFRHDRKRVVKMIATMQSTRFLAKMISSYKEVDWVKELYEITDDIFREWYIGSDNKLRFNQDDSEGNLVTQ